MKKTILMVFMLVMMMCATVSAQEMSPQWVKNLEAAKNANQMVATAWISMHEKDANGN